MADPIKIQIQEKIANGTQTYHPETDASVVKFADPSNNSAWGNNVQDAIENVITDLGDIKSNISGGTGVVTGVKGNAESTYRAGQVNITPDNIGVYDKTYMDQVIGAATEGLNALSDAVSELGSDMELLGAVITGRPYVHVFKTIGTMQQALKNAQSSDYRIGDTLYIEATDVPDYWISGILTTNAGTYGYYQISPLETQKVSLVDYQTKTDNSLDTTSKTVVGAINEVYDYVGHLDEQNETNVTNIENIISGSQVVGKATNATNSTNAQEAQRAREAEEAHSLYTARTISLSGDASGSTTFDGSSDKTITVALANSGVSAGTYSAVTVDAKGRVTFGGQLIEIAESVNDTPSANLVTGGIFFKRLS